MIHSPRFTVILDACVIYPAPVRDLLLHMAAEGLFKPKWNKVIHEEWVRNLLAKRTDLKRKQLDDTVAAMNAAFPDATIENYEQLIPNLKLPDPSDRHVLASAIKANADLIVTFNLRDFPSRYLKPYDVEVQHPDEFVSNIIDLNKERAFTAFRNQVQKLTNPPMTFIQVLESLKRCGLEEGAKRLNDTL